MTDPYRQFSLPLTEHIGAVVMFQQRTYTFTGTLEQCERAYRSAQTHNLLAGWWSVLSVLAMNWAALISNWSAIRHVRRLALQSPTVATTGYVPTPPGAAYPAPKR